MMPERKHCTRCGCELGPKGGYGLGGLLCGDCWIVVLLMLGRGAPGYAVSAGTAEAAR